MSQHPQHIRSDGTFDIERIGLKVHWKRDLYHFLLTSTWRLFICSMIFVYLGSNLVFALLYSLDASGIANAKNFADIYFSQFRRCQRWVMEPCHLRLPMPI